METKKTVLSSPKDDGRDVHCVFKFLPDGTTTVEDWSDSECQQDAVLSVQDAYTEIGRLVTRGWTVEYCGGFTVPE